MSELRTITYKKSCAKVEPEVQRLTPEQVVVNVVKNDKSIDVWSNRIAAWVQVGTLIVVAFGYFYTVIPVMQKERLAEEEAKLEQTKDSLTKSVQKLSDASNNYKREIQELGQSKVALNQDNLSLLKKQGELKKSNEALLADISHDLRKLTKAHLDLALTGKLLDEATFKMFEEDMVYAMAVPSMNSAAIAPPFDVNESKNLRSQLLAQLPDEEEKVQAILDTLARDKEPVENDMPGGREVFLRYLADFNQRFQKIKPEFRFPKPDVDAWVAAYNSQISDTNGLKACVDKYDTQWIQMNKWGVTTVKSLEKTSDWIEEQKKFRIWCMTSHRASVQMLFFSSWQKILSTYATRYIDLPDAVYGKKKLSPIPQDIFLPPKNADVESSRQ